MTDRVDTASMLIHASPSTIYQAFATSGVMERWLPPEGMTGSMFEFDFREGGSYRMRLTYDDPGKAKGKSSEEADDVAVRFVRLVKDRRIEQAVAFTSDDPAFAGEMRVTWTFEPVDRGTLVSVRCENVPHGITAEDHEAGLNASLRNLAAFTETGR